MSDEEIEALVMKLSDGLEAHHRSFKAFTGVFNATADELAESPASVGAVWEKLRELMTSERWPESKVKMAETVIKNLNSVIAATRAGRSGPMH